MLCMIKRTLEMLEITKMMVNIKWTLTTDLKRANMSTEASLQNTPAQYHRATTKTIIGQILIQDLLLLFVV